MDGKSKITGVQVPAVITLRQQSKLLPFSIPYFSRNFGPGYQEFLNLRVYSLTHQP
jgi:hypothetical protein